MQPARLFLRNCLVFWVLLASALAQQKSPAEFRPGEIWLDDHGLPIDAHGGGILLHEGVYYWFGEIRAGKGGVRVYSSTDLYHWQDRGVALALADDPQSDITAGCKIERPKVIYNARTKKFVMWFHLEIKGTGYASSRSGVAVADQPAGPYTFVESFRPNAGQWPRNTPEEARKPLSREEQAYLEPAPMLGGTTPKFPADLLFRRDFAGGQMARDMNLFVDDDGAAYHVYASEGNGTLQISRLADDYLRPAGEYVRVLPGEFNEAPAVFKFAGKYYLITSGCTGWRPNSARLAVAESIWGPWKSLGYPCVGPNADLTFGGQSTSVLALPGKPGALIFLADRWRADNLADSRHLWLPIQFRGGKPVIGWMDRWDLSFFDRPAPAMDAGAFDGVGLRRSAFGLWQKNSDDAWWIARAREYAAAFPPAQPTILHYVSSYESNGSMTFGFAQPGSYRGETKQMRFVPGPLDHERALNAYDQAGVSCIIALQTGDADPLLCLEIAHAALGQHRSIIGYSVDGEWYFTQQSPDLRGRTITAADAAGWMKKVASWNPDYLLFLRHGSLDRLPPAYRDEHLCLLDAATDFADQTAWQTDLQRWNAAASGAKMSCELGQPADRSWWSMLAVPPVDLGRSIHQIAPGCRYLFWSETTADGMIFQYPGPSRNSTP